MENSKEAPEGVSIKIPKVWMKSLTGSNFNSLTDPSVDEPVITISKKTLEEFGAGGQDKLNFTIAAHLEKLGYVANVSIGVAWDPQIYPQAPLLYQSNLKSAAFVEQKHRMEFLPDYPYMRAVGEHELVIMAQIREVTTYWRYKDEDYVSFTEFPHIGEMAVRKIKVIIKE